MSGQCKQFKLPFPEIVIISYSGSLGRETFFQWYLALLLVATGTQPRTSPFFLASIQNGAESLQCQIIQNSQSEEFLSVARRAVKTLVRTPRSHVGGRGFDTHL